MIGASRVTRVRRARTLTLGTDCSGMEVPALALRNMNIRHAHLFSSESHKACRKVIQHVFKPKRLYTDVRLRGRAPRCHVYAFCHPCQMFSSLGKNSGEADKRFLLRHSARYIRLRRPRAIISENVSGLRFRHRSVLGKLVLFLRKLGYTVYWKVLNTRDHGVRHFRRRLYLVAMLVEKHTFVWPEPIPFIIATWLSPFNPATDTRQAKLPAHPREKQLVKEAWKKHMEKDHIHPLKVPVFNDVDCSPGFATSQVRMIPCLTAKRGSTRGIWVSTRGRRIDLEEMFRFQGINPADVD